jgi:uncharacterized damage-inducible protein DinB
VSIVGDWLLAEFDQEMALTRQVLSRAPEAAFAWTPHERSLGLGALAAHLSLIPDWGRAILEHDGYDLATSRAVAPTPPPTAESVMSAFDTHVSEVRRGLAGRTDAELEAPWALRSGSRTLLSMPRYAALRMFLISHTIHHRGQLTVYLRMQNVPVPALYGPSADERM